MFHSYNDTKEKLNYLKASIEGRNEPVNVSWLIRTLEETNKKAERYEKALESIKTIIVNESPVYFDKGETLDEIFEVAKKSII
jgi:hypothetical protein